MKAAERERDALEDAKVEAEAYLAKKKALAVKQRNLYQHYM